MSTWGVQHWILLVHIFLEIVLGYIIIIMSRGRHGNSNHRLFSLTAWLGWKPRLINAQHYLPFGSESVGHRWIPFTKGHFVESIPISSDHDGDTRWTFACWTFNNMSTNILKLVDPILPPPGMLFYCHNDCNKRWGIGSLAVNKYFTDIINIYFNLCCYFYQHCCLLLLLASPLI